MTITAQKTGSAWRAVAKQGAQSVTAIAPTSAAARAAAVFHLLRLIAQ